MALPMLQPPIIIVPHHGEIKAKNLTINLVIWIQETTFETLYDFLKGYLEDHCSYLVESKIDVSDFSDTQLDEMATHLSPILAGLDYKNEDDTTDPDPKNAGELKELIDKRIEEMEARTAEIMKNTFKSFKTGMTPSMKLHNAMNAPGLKAMQDAMNSPGLKAMQDAMNSPGLMALQNSFRPSLVNQVTDFQTSQQRIAETLKIALPTISIGQSLASMATISIPGGEIAATVALLTKQMSFLSPSVSKALIATQPKYLDRDYFLKGMKLPGFEITAQAGLSGLASKALSAEILAKYHTEPPTQNSVTG